MSGSSRKRKISSMYFFTVNGKYTFLPPTSLIDASEPDFRFIFPELVPPGYFVMISTSLVRFLFCFLIGLYFRARGLLLYGSVLGILFLVRAQC